MLDSAEQWERHLKAAKSSGTTIHNEMDFMDFYRSMHQYVRNITNNIKIFEGYQEDLKGCDKIPINTPSQGDIYKIAVIEHDINQKIKKLKNRKLELIIDILKAEKLFEKHFPNRDLLSCWILERE